MLPPAEQLRRARATLQAELAREAMPAAQRLADAYRRQLQALDKQLKAASTSDELARAQIARLQAQAQEALAGMQDAILRVAEPVAAQAITRGIAAGRQALQAVNVGIGAPNAAAIRALVGYVDSPAFVSMVESYGDYHATQVTDTMLASAAAGKGPTTIIREVRRYLANIPLADAQRMVRTVQLWSARAANHEIYRDNADVLDGWTWSAAKSGSCMSCLAMDGKLFPLTATLNDHHNGRCAPIPHVRGTDMPYQSGEAWFRAQSEDAQRGQMGEAAWTAWRDGAIRFDQFTAIYSDPIYGPMRSEAALKDMVGETAALAYARQAKQARQQR